MIFSIQTTIVLKAMKASSSLRFREKLLVSPLLLASSVLYFTIERKITSGMKWFQASCGVEIYCKNCLGTPLAPEYTLWAGVLPTTEVGVFFPYRLVLS